jgi:hypothetical protein
LKKLVLICPFFGKFKIEQMKLWLNSCKMNIDVDWIIYTDDHYKYDYPVNVIVKYITLKDLKNKFEKKLGFEINLDQPYKLCDYKPLYGYLFSEDIESYEYWGHCDINDMIFGNFDLLFKSDVLNKNDKIGFLGHLTIYKNTHENNQRFKILCSTKENYKTVMLSSTNMAFDELNEYSINSIYRSNNFSIGRIDELYDDISCLYYNFRCSKYDFNFKHENNKKSMTVIFEWDNGRLYEIAIVNKKIFKREILYVHYQKRMIKFDILVDKLNNSNHFYFVPNKFIDNLEMSYKSVKKYMKSRIYFPFFKYKFLALKYKIKQMLKEGRGSKIE